MPLSSNYVGTIPASSFSNPCPHRSATVESLENQSFLLIFEKKAAFPGAGRGFGLSHRCRWNRREQRKRRRFR
jgi:hypothetical protein